MTMYILISILILLNLVLLVMLIFVLGVIFRGAPYVITSNNRLKVIRNIMKDLPRDRVAELGSGDGRVVFALAELGNQVDGFELNPILVVWSKIVARFRGLQNQSKFVWGDYWKYNLSEYQYVYVYGMNPIMNKLSQKLKSELQSGAMVISADYKLPDWSPSKKVQSFYIYQC